MKPGDIIAAPPVDASAAPVVVASSVTSNNDTRETSGAWSQLALVAGAGLALLTGLLFFGRRLRNRFGSVAINAPAPPERTEETTAEKRETIVDDVDFRFDDTISEEALSLDADLGAGTGLGDSGDLDVSQEFTFDSVAQATRDIDLEITAEAAAEPEQPTTDIIPPQDGDEVTAELTANLPVDVDAVNDDIAEDDITSKMLAAGSDVTVEMQIESGTVDTKKDT
jgi:hypothetical protein